MLSSSTQRALDCASCRHPGAVVECAQCEASLCLQCAQDRHRRGTLAVHTFKLVPSDADAASSPLLMRVGAPCSYCDNRPSVLFCPTCSLIFCGACATSFHSIGSLVAHVASYSDKVNVADPGKFNGDSSALIDTALQPTDVITLKIGAFGIAVTVERLEHIMEKPLSHFLAINCESQTLRLYCKGDESQTYEFSRPFDDLLNASVNADHPSCISIQFKSFSMQADVMMIREAEGRQVVQLVNQIRKKQCAFNIKPIDSLGDNIVTFKGFAHKKGKVTWSLRHLIVSGHFLYVYRDVTADMPLNSIDLLGSPAFKTSSKQLSIGTTDRQFVFRLKSKMQTDILNAVLQHCHGIIENADTTHNLVNKVTAMPASDNARMPTANVRLSTARSSVSPSPHAPRFRRTTSQTATNLFARSPTECLPREAQAIQLEDELQKIRLGFSSAAGQRHPPVNQDGVKADLADCLVAANAALPSMGDGLSMRNNGNDVLPLLLLLAESMEHGASFTGELFIPSSLWSQNAGAKLLAYGVKKENFAILREKLELLEADDDPALAEAKALEVLVVALDQIQTTMSQHIPYIHAVKKPIKLTRTNMEKLGAKIKKYGHSVVKKATRATSASQKVSDPTDYNQMVREIVSMAIALNNRGAQASPDELVDGLGEVLARANAFFRDVLCSVIVEDLRIEMHRHIKQETRALLNP
ncbi:B box-type domain-containing protein [Plasmodiophora brassicae]